MSKDFFVQIVARGAYQGFGVSRSSYKIICIHCGNDKPEHAADCMYILARKYLSLSPEQREQIDCLVSDNA
jgi:hypothetical protein